MTDDEILAEFRAADALLQGHFLLSSGRHSEYYLQCARVLMDTGRAGRLAAALAAKMPRELRQTIDIVVSPAMGRSEEHTSELQSLMRTPYAVFFLKKKIKTYTTIPLTHHNT